LEKPEASPLSLGFGSSHEQAAEDCDQPPDDIPPSPSEVMNAENKEEATEKLVVESAGEGEACVQKEASAEHEAPVEDAEAEEIPESKAEAPAEEAKIGTDATTEDVEEPITTDDITPALEAESDPVEDQTKTEIAAAEYTGDEKDEGDKPE